MKIQVVRLVVFFGVLGAVICTFAADSLYVDPTGNVGIGTSAPTRKLQVDAVDNAVVYVRNTSQTAAERAMFILQNNGKTRFLITNGADGWTFDNAGNRFQISKVGTGVAEFEVHDNGDGYFVGNVYANQVLLTSSRDSKTEFKPVDGARILKELDGLDVSSWRYKNENEGERHVGPTAEDFQEAFKLGDGSHISAIDAGGLAFAAIKELHQVAQKHAKEMESLEKQNARLVAANASLENRLKTLEARMSTWNDGSP